MHKSPYTFLSHVIQVVSTIIKPFYDAFSVILSLYMKMTVEVDTSSYF